MYRTIILLLITVFAEAAFSLQPWFRNITMADGLPDAVVTSLCRSSTGDLWIGTELGLVKFDGQLVQALPKSCASLWGEHVVDILEDDDGIVWIAMRGGGLARYDPANDRLLRFQNDPSDHRTIASNRLNDLSEHLPGHLLIAAENVPIIFLDKKDLIFSYWSGEGSIHPDHASEIFEGYGWCHKVVDLENDTLWVGLLHQGVNLFAEKNTGAIMGQAFGHDQDIPTRTNVIASDHGLFACGWFPGIEMMDRSGRSQLIALPDEVTALAPWKNGILAGTKSHGLYVIDGNGSIQENWLRDRTLPNSLIGDRIRCILVDEDGVLWVGTERGLSYHDPKAWVPFMMELYGEDRSVRPEVSIFDIAEYDGTLRIFTSDGIFETSAHDPGEFRNIPIMENGVALAPTCYARSTNGVHYLGTETGLVVCDPSTGHVDQRFNYYTDTDEGPRPTGMFQVRSIITLPDPEKLVVGVLGYGVFLVYPKTGRWVPMADYVDGPFPDLGLALVRCMRSDRNNGYWVASASGAYRISEDKSGTFTIEKVVSRANGSGLAGSDVQDLLLKDDRMWIALRDGGLASMAGDRIEDHVPNEGPLGSVLGLTHDAQGRIWMTTNSSIRCFDPVTGEFLKVPIPKEIQFTSAITTLSNGHIAMAAENTLIIIDPERSSQLAPLPRPMIAGLRSPDIQLPELTANKMLELSYRGSMVELQVSAQYHGAIEPLEFLYRLKGSETDWKKTDATRPIAYSALPPGEHDLLVRVRDPYGRTGGTHELLTIKVHAPFWQTWWFYAIIALSVSTAFYAWSRYRIEQALRVQRVRNRIASDLHDEVGSSLSSITIGSQLAMKLGNGQSEQVKDILTRIGNTSSESLRSMSDIVWAIDPKNDEGEALLHRMRRIANELLESKGVETVFTIGQGVDELRISMDVRKELLLLYKEAIHNASKYAGAQRVLIDIRMGDGGLTLTIQDEGKGFDLALHPDGHGLESMRRRAAKIGSSLHMESVAGKGTLVQVRVDLAKIRE